MNLFIELFLIGVGLAMDAFAVAICKGLSMSKFNKKTAMIIGVYFGSFQALMPLIGYLIGFSFRHYIASIDHWLAFILLGIIGGKMLKEGIDTWNDLTREIASGDAINHKELFILAIATSIDALAVGITFAFLNKPIVEAISIIGVLTLIISVVGVYVGNYFGCKYKAKAEFIGGLILILLGVKILIEHLFI